MKYASESGGMSTSVHDWKPCAADRFAKLMHEYTTKCSDEFGHEGLTMTAMKLDHISTATIYYMPKNGKAPDAIRSPVLMTVSMLDGKIVCFESLKYGVNVPEGGYRNERGNQLSPDGVEIIETGMRVTTKPAPFSGTLSAKNTK